MTKPIPSGNIMNCMVFQWWMEVEPWEALAMAMALFCYMLDSLQLRKFVVYVLKPMDTRNMYESPLFQGLPIMQLNINTNLILYCVNPILTGSGIFFFTRHIFFFQQVYNAVIYRHSGFLGAVQRFILYWDSKLRVWELWDTIYSSSVSGIICLSSSEPCISLFFCVYCDDPSFSFLCYCNLIFHFAALPISSHLDETLQSRIYANFKRWILGKLHAIVVNVNKGLP